MSNFIMMNQMQIDAVNLALNINAQALQNAEDIVQAGIHQAGIHQGSRQKAQWTAKATQEQVDPAGLVRYTGERTGF